MVPSPLFPRKKTLVSFIKSCFTAQYKVFYSLNLSLEKQGQSPCQQSQPMLSLYANSKDIHERGVLTLKTGWKVLTQQSNKPYYSCSFPYKHLTPQDATWEVSRIPGEAILTSIVRLKTEQTWIPQMGQLSAMGHVLLLNPEGAEACGCFHSPLQTAREKANAHLPHRKKPSTRQETQGGCCPKPSGRQVIWGDCIQKSVFPQQLQSLFIPDFQSGGNYLLQESYIRAII